MISYWLNYQSSGLESVSVSRRECSAACVQFDSWRADRPPAASAGSGRRAGCARVLSVFAGALFLLHPVQTESVAYVASRSETMSVFFFLGAFAVFVCRDASAAHSSGGSSRCLLLFGTGVRQRRSTRPFCRCCCC